MPKKYRAADRSYLCIVDHPDTWDEPPKIRIGWYFPSDEEMGAILGDRLVVESPNETEEENKARWEIKVSTEAAAPFSEGGVKEAASVLTFKTMRQARLALLAANAALFQAPMPEWAIKATDAGWKPPKGWKP